MISKPWWFHTLLAAVVVLAQAAAAKDDYLFNDSHFHLTNYVQEGPTIQEFLAMMDGKVGRAALFGIPLQQTWSYRVSGDDAPTYYLDTDTPLYYYSFTDAFIAMTYRSLPPKQQARFDPMITGFNPADMYAADHIRRVLTMFPGVFAGIGEFTIHKEFVSSKVAGDVPSLTDPALDRVLSFCAETGLLALIHSDIDTPFDKDGPEPVNLKQMKALLQRHPKTTIIWAHAGLGRVVDPVANQVAILDAMLADPAFAHVYLDLSWDEVAKYLVATPTSLERAAGLINKYPDRFLFGTDALSPSDAAKYMKTYEAYAPLLKLLDPQASEKFRKGNYERLFDQAKTRVRAWEKANVR
jgi:hypothetical protein